MNGRNGLGGMCPPPRLLSLPAVCTSYSQPAQEQAFPCFQAFGQQMSCRAREQTLQCAQTAQTFLTKSLDDEAFVVSPLALHDLPSTSTHIHLWIFFFYLADAYVCLSARALHEPDGGAEESGIVPVLGARELAAGLRQVHGRTSRM